MKRQFKTKRKVNSNLQRYFHPWTKNHGAEQIWKEGDYVIGKYVMDVQDNFDNLCPIIEVLDYELTSPVIDRDGNEVEIINNNLQLNHAGSLKYAFYGENDKGKERIPLGEIVQVTYIGVEVLESGKYAGKKSHQVEVAIMEEDSDDETF